MAQSTLASGAKWTAPEVNIGDQVWFYENPKNMKDPINGVICRRPGAKTVYILAYSESFGWVEKPSVHHVDDPELLQRVEWQQFGAWELSPTTKLLRRLSVILPQLEPLLVEPKRTTKKSA